MRKPLVSILISAYNAQETVVETLQSAVAQTWPHKEIIFVDDGSTDATAELARRFTSQGVTVISKKNGGLSAGINTGFGHCNGEYIQFLDADDLLAPNKIERQLSTLRESDSKRLLFSSPWAPFYYRTRNAQFVLNAVWEDLTPVEWFLRKMTENLHMQNATWLVSRELVDAAGPWNVDLQYDQDGEYFARVLMESEGTRFITGTGIYYRASGVSSISYIGNSNVKRDSLFLSMKLQIQYLRALEESERVHKACLTYLQNWYGIFHPERPDLVAEMQKMAAEFGGHLEEPTLRWKYAWMKPVFGLRFAKWAEMRLPQYRASFIRHCDRAMYKIESNSKSLSAPMI